MDNKAQCHSCKNETEFWSVQYKETRFINKKCIMDNDSLQKGD